MRSQGHGDSSGKPGKRGWRKFLLQPFLSPRFYFLVALGLSTTAVGCTRKFFRERADIDALAMIHEKDRDPRWKLDNYYVYPDPRARFADWSDPDRPPMPPDDPASTALAPVPQRPGKPGVAYVVGKDYLEVLGAWDAENRARAAAEATQGQAATIQVTESQASSADPNNPLSAIPNIDYELTGPVAVDRPLPVKPQVVGANCQKPFLITMDQAVELAFFNSREMQTQRENVLLAALPVTAERFAFATQFYAIEQIFRNRFGSKTPGGPANTWQANSTLGFSKLFSTGALLLAQFANQTVVNLGNLNFNAPVKTVSTSTVSLDIVQPLLRGGGRAVTLEPLTQVERNLLYEIRDFARFEQQFYVFIVAGQPQFIPGITAGVAVLSFSVTSPGAFVPFSTPVTAGLAGPGIGPQVVPGNGAPRLGPTGVQTIIPQGFLPTVQNKAQLVIQYKNVQQLERFLRLFRVYLEGGIVQPVQVNQVEQGLLNAIEGLLGNQSGYRVNLDELKIQLGLPTNVPIEVDDTPLRPIYKQLRAYEDNSRNFTTVSESALKLGKAEPVSSVRESLHRLATESALVKGTNFQKQFSQRWDAWEKLPKRTEARDPVSDRLRQLLEERRKLLDLKSELEDKNKELAPAQARRLNELDIEVEIGRFERTLRIYEEEPWKTVKDANRAAELRDALFLTAHRDFLTILEGAFRERLDVIRRAWPDLPPLCVDGVDLLSADDEVAMAAIARAALINRLDLMNQRAQLVDSWRKIRVVANSLMGVLNVEYHLDSSTPSGLAHPFAFSGSGTRHELIFNAQPPLVRRVERNNYRSALIAYQQQRRALMAAEDQVLYAIRFQLRNMRAVGNNYHRIQKRAIELAYAVVDQALEAFNQPPAPGGPAGIPGMVGAPSTGSSQQADPAALTNQLLTAQNRLVSAQQDLYNTWIQYLTTRMALYRDMGLMPLDARGVWTDDVVANCYCRPSSEPGTVNTADGLPAAEPQRLPDPGQAAAGPPLVP